MARASASTVGRALNVEVSALTFDRQFSRFAEQVLRRSGQAFTSFRDGLPAQWEDYKEDVRKEALRLLEVDKWKRADIGKGRILERVIQAIEIDYAKPRLRNNLVFWQKRYGDKRRSHRALLDAKADASARRSLEELLLAFFQGRLKEGDAFERFQGLVGARYDLVAYLFFLKDWNRFMPIAPTTFDKAFELLGVELVTAKQSSWENYARYNEALRVIQRMLLEVAGVAGARLVDAHSFCWMLVRQELPMAAAAPVIPLPEALADTQAVTHSPEPSALETVFEAVDDQKFAQLDAERRRLGAIAQDIALQSERRRLREAGHPTPEEAAIPVWDEWTRGYDILSVELDNTPRHIEVKAARRSTQTLSFFLTAHEWKQSRSLPNYHFYLVVNAQSRRPRILAIESSQVSTQCLVPVVYAASLRAPGLRG
jgi:hypothetical protein